MFHSALIRTAMGRIWWRNRVARDLFREEDVSPRAVVESFGEYIQMEDGTEKSMFTFLMELFIYSTAPPDASARLVQAITEFQQLQGESLEAYTAYADDIMQTLGLLNCALPREMTTHSFAAGLWDDAERRWVEKDGIAAGKTIFELRDAILTHVSKQQWLNLLARSQRGNRMTSSAPN